MGKKRFFDDRLKYLSFIQNTSEKRAISEQLAPHIASMEQNRTFLRVLDAGTGDGTVKSNVIKTFHKYHPYTSLLITGKEISYEDLKNTLDKMPDRFIEHPNLLVTMTNVKFAELGHIESSNKIKGKNVKSYTLILKDDNSFDFHAQINKLNTFIKKNWGIEIDNKSRTSYANPCIIRIYREDHKRYIEPFIDNDYKNNNYDLIIASQAYRAASEVRTKVNNVIAPLMRLLNKSGKLLVTHSCGGDTVEKILKVAWKDKNPFPNKAKDIIEFLKNNPNINAHIRGHVCCIPNSKLSKERAQRVYDYLIQNSIAASRLSYKGYSNKEPFTSPELSDADRQSNRRVDVIFTKVK